MTVTVPAWFDAAIDRKPEALDLQVDGATIAYRAWGEPGSPVLVLVHGGAANSAWWDHVAPYLSTRHRVVAPDLSGHGDSDRRQTYTLQGWSEEVLAVAEHENRGVDDSDGTRLAPMVFGHSMGGFVALTAARDHGDRLSGVLVIDSPLTRDTHEGRERFRRRAEWFQLRSYSSLEEMVPRFRPVPTDPWSLDFVLEHVARQSATSGPDGWQWKFDPGVFVGASMDVDTLHPLDCRFHYIKGERGLATFEQIALIRENVRQDFPVTVIADAGHHIMLDQPIALIAALEAVAGTWSCP